jgi:hypothetical protein
MASPFSLGSVSGAAPSLLALGQLDEAPVFRSLPSSASSDAAHHPDLLHADDRWQPSHSHSPRFQAQSHHFPLSNSSSVISFAVRVTPL